MALEPQRQEGAGPAGLQGPLRPLPGPGPAALSWASAHSSLTSSFYKHRPSQAQREGDERGGGCSL